MKKRGSSGFRNDAADKIWNDHLGNNAFTRHRDQCAECLAFMHASADAYARCPEGERIFNEMIDDVLTQIDEALLRQN